MPVNAFVTPRRILQSRETGMAAARPVRDAKDGSDQHVRLRGHSPWVSVERTSG